MLSVFITIFHRGSWYKRDGIAALHAYKQPFSTKYVQQILKVTVINDDISKRDKSAYIDNNEGIFATTPINKDVRTGVLGDLWL